MAARKLSIGISIVTSALKRNIKPGIVLWVLLILFAIAYTSFMDFKQWMDNVGEFKSRNGYLFSFTAFFIVGSVLPELLKVIFFQQLKVTSANIKNIVFTGLVFGMAGIWSDFFFGMQSKWFGTDNNITTIVKKMATDQFVFSPVFNTIMLSVLYWREHGFPVKGWQDFSPRLYAKEKLLSVVVSTWLVWIPGTILIYFMPLSLQLPVTCLILCFFSLIVTFLSSGEVEVQNNPGQG